MARLSLGCKVPTIFARLLATRLGPVPLCRGRFQALVLLGAIAGLLGGSARLQGGEAEELQFFEQKIRPVLVAKCYECHSATSKALQGGLLLDQKQGLLTGGDSGPALLPGKPAESLLLQALKYDGLEMPPSGKLPDAVIKDFEQWIARGAVDPRSGQVSTRAKIDVEAGRQFWAYRLPQSPQPPKVQDQAWPLNDIDRFVLAPVEQKKLHPAAEASRAVLIRRLYFDLWGLPPEPEEVDRFVADPSPDAYEQLVDRLLASSHFGERWGRHWLDVVRYAESLTLRGFVLKDAWRYRDYVIESFQNDAPYDRFLLEQVAGDLMPFDTVEQRQRQVIATAFLALGNTNLEEQDKQQLVMDIVDEQLDVIGKGLLAQTITCARCHDHKFDPIPTKDYYALAGILKSTKTVEHSNVSKWLEIPLPMEAEQEKQFRAQTEELAQLQSQMTRLKTALSNRAGALQAGSPNAPAIVQLADLKGEVVDDAQATKVGNWQASQHVKRYIGQGYLHDANNEKGEKSLTFIPTLPGDGVYEVRLAYVTGSGRSNKVPVTIMSAEGELDVEVDQSVPPPIEGRWISLGSFRFERTGQSFVIVSNEGTKGVVTADAVQFLPEPKESNATANSTTGDKAKDKDGDRKGAEKKEPTAADPQADAMQQEIKRIESRMKEVTATLAKRPTWLGVQEEKAAGDTQIHIRGNVHNLGETVPRGFLQVAHYEATADIPEKQSGRLELAQWLASRQNPLTARVMANRVWLWLMGQGLVRSPDNFGSTGEAPTHPELLDHLAVELMDHNWSVKHLVRQIVTSRTYRQSSLPESPRVAAVDPENRLWSHGNRRRLDAESFRDTLLTISRTLDLTPGGPSLEGNYPASDYNYVHQDKRRSVYSPAFRNSLVELFEVFDVADPSTVTGQRNTSTVAPQALYLMNHPFVIEQARLTSQRLLQEDVPDDQARLVRGYRLILGREPSAGELSRSQQFLAQASQAPSSTERAWWQWAQMMICSVDFRYVN